jgi:hypothetical protein
MTLDLGELYPLPWTHRANGLSWLEITNQCDLGCHGCYRKQDSRHKTVAEIDGELDLFRRLRTVDCMSIAGGEPLLHPELEAVVRSVRRHGFRPILNTNGVKMTRERLAQLKAAGLAGVTFHVDSSQDRPDCRDATFDALTARKDELADMVRDAGGLICNFNHTISATTLDEIPRISAWARRRAADVDGLIFVCYRDAHVMGAFDFFADGRRLTDLGELTEGTDRSWTGDRPVTVNELFEALTQDDREAAPCAYLSGTGDPASLKWLFVCRLVHAGETLGYLSPKLMQIAQLTTNLLFDKWLSFLPKLLLTLPKSLFVPLALADGEARKAVQRLPARLLKKPLAAVQPVKAQTIVLVQPMDVLADGTIDMCESCPDMTVYEGRLERSCRLEELKRYGTFFTAAPKGEAARARQRPPGTVYPYHTLFKCTPGPRPDA